MVTAQQVMDAQVHLWSLKNESHPKTSQYWAEVTNGLVVINPEIIAKSDLMVYLPDGEGCLSVNRNTEGLVTPRHYKIIVKCALFDSVTEKVRNVKLTLEGYPAIVFQHENDHLDGIMYVDKMYKVKDLDPKILPLYTLNEDDEEEDSEEEKSE